MLRNLFQKIKFYYTVNWTKTLFFNYRKFPFAVARQLPVYFYGSVKLKNIAGEVVIDAPIKSGMIGFGQPYELISRSRGIAELSLEGKMIFKGHVQFGKDYMVHVGPNAVLEMGNMSSMGHSGKIICFDKITFGNFARVGFESQLSDTTAHQMLDTNTKQKLPMTGPIQLGHFNYISNRVTILAQTITPDYCTVASNSLCTKDYTAFGANILIGGIPAKLLKTDISRDWEGEMQQLEKWLKV